MDTDAPALHPELVDIADLSLDPANARLHDKRNLDTIGASLSKYRQRKAIVVNRRTMTIEAGNGTVAAALEAGHTQIVAVFVDDDDETAAGYAVADNRTADLAAWDVEVLTAKVEAFPDVDWGALGFGADDIKGLSAGGSSAPSGDSGGGSDPTPPEPPIPAPPAEPKTKRGEVIQLGPHVLHCADCMDVMAGLADNSVDAIVTDPPYGLSPDGRARTWDDIEALRAEGKGPKSGFMGKSWDAGVPGKKWARECLRVLKPGGHIVAFSATRTYHRLTCAVEDVGFEVRDMFDWLYWSAMPKSLDVSKAIDAHHGVERKVVGHRAGLVGGGFGDTGHGLGSSNSAVPITEPATNDAIQWSGWGTMMKPAHEPAVIARKPLSESTVALNVLKWGTGATNIESGKHPDDGSWPGPWSDGDNLKWPANIYATPKPATSERSAGVDEAADGHPTVKPVKLMAQLIALFCPPGGVVLEPFGGSGTTLVAAARFDCKVIASEMDPAYCDIIRARVEWSMSEEAQPRRRKPGKPRTPARDGDKVQARRRVQTLVLNGTLPRPEDVICVDCEDAPGREYDHHLGYGSDHHEDVEALCSGCHHKREAERVKQP